MEFPIADRTSADYAREFLLHRARRGALVEQERTRWYPMQDDRASKPVRGRVLNLRVTQ